MEKSALALVGFERGVSKLSEPIKYDQNKAITLQDKCFKEGKTYLSQ